MNIPLTPELEQLVNGCMAVGTLLLGGAEAQQVPVKAPQTADALNRSAKDGNTAALRQLRTLAGAGNVDFMNESGKGCRRMQHMLRVRNARRRKREMLPPFLATLRLQAPKRKPD